MKYMVTLLSYSLCVALSAGVACGAQEPFKSDREQNSYAIGANMVRQLKQRGASIDPDFVVKGLQDGAKGKAKLTDAEVRAILKKLREEAQKMMIEESQKTVAENKKRSAEFLSRNGSHPEVKTLPGGTQYRVLKAGDGKIPTEDDTAILNFRGTLVDGKEFDVSEPGKPASWKIDQLIPGLFDVLTAMPAGSRWQAAIPAGKGYGAGGNGKNIGPFEVLVYELELVGIK